MRPTRPPGDGPLTRQNASVENFSVPCEENNEIDASFIDSKPFGWQCHRQSDQIWIFYNQFLAILGGQMAIYFGYFQHILKRFRLF